MIEDSLMDFSLQQKQPFSLYDEFNNDFNTYLSPLKPNYSSSSRQISPSTQNTYYQFRENYDEYCIQNNDQDINNFLQNQNKKIGILTYEERQRKIDFYRMKRTLRVWVKKINYDCRKRVADGRVRIKGRFITKDQAKKINHQL